MTTTSLDAREELRASLREFLTDKAPLSVVRQQVELTQPLDRKLWETLAGDIGAQGLAIPETLGGAGAGWAEVAIALEETGRALTPLPLLATLGLAFPALLAADDSDAQSELLPRIASGDLVATVAWVGDDGAWDGSGNTVRAHVDGSDSRLSGRVSYVIDGDTADLLLVVAVDGDGTSLFAVAGDADGVTRTPMPTLDLTRRLATIDLDGVSGRRIGRPGTADAIVSFALDHARVLLAAEMLGGAQACLDMSVDYANSREQFGRPIGSFQAVKHKCAETLVQVEAARGGVEAAALALDEEPDRVKILAPMVKAYAGEAFFRAAGENIQIHGGIGFTWEHDAHLYFKRAKSSDLLLGDAAHHRAALADRLAL